MSRFILACVVSAFRHTLARPAMSVLGAATDGSATAPLGRLSSTWNSSSAVTPTNDPVKRLLAVKSCSRQGSPISGGIASVNRLPRRRNLHKAINAAKNGIDPLNRLLLTSKVSSFIRPCSEGIALLRWLLKAERRLGPVRPEGAEIAPNNRFADCES